MTEWDVYLVIYSLLGFATAIAGIAFGLVKALEKREEKYAQRLKESEAKSEKALRTIVDKSEENTKELISTIQGLNLTVRDLHNYLKTAQRDIEGLSKDLRELDNVTFKSFQEVEKRIQAVELFCARKSPTQNKPNE